jgi:hypothetical protein
MEPASTIITKLGGPARLARELNLHRVTVAKWKRPREAGGTGGLIPNRHTRAILNLARDSGVEITAECFLPPEDEAAQ